MPSTRYRFTALAVLAVLAGCGGSDADAGASQAAGSDAPLAAMQGNRVTQLLDAGQPVFGIFSGDHTPEQGAQMAAVREADFVFYSLEDGPFDTPAMQAYIEAMNGAALQAGVEPRPVLLRIPPITDPAVARQQVEQGLAAGAAGIVFPHVAREDQAQTAVEVMGDDLWPVNPQGNLLNIALVEDQEGIGNAAAIVATPGLGVVIPGPGDLRRAYEGDMEAVENAIQTVLSECKAAGVICGITAGVDDIGKRLQEGFRVIIVTSPEALTAGRQAAGRTDS